jgi:hypothetical protein
VNPKYLLQHDVETINIAPININMNGILSNIAVSILKQSADIISLKSINDMYTKRFA